MWPQSLTRQQVINMLEQYTFWYDDEYTHREEEYLEDEKGPERTWVEIMENIDPCWPDR